MSDTEEEIEIIETESEVELDTEADEVEEEELDTESDEVEEEDVEVDDDDDQGIEIDEDDHVIEVEQVEDLADYNQVIISDDHLYGYISYLIHTNQKNAYLDKLKFFADRKIRNYMSMLKPLEKPSCWEEAPRLFPLVGISRKIFESNEKTVAQYDDDSAIQESISSFISTFNKTEGFTTYTNNKDKRFDLLCPFQSDGRGLVCADTDCIHMWEGAKGKPVFQHVRIMGSTFYTLPDTKMEKILLKDHEKFTPLGIVNVATKHRALSKHHMVFDVDEYVKHLLELTKGDKCELVIHQDVDLTDEKSLQVTVQAITDDHIVLLYKKHLVFYSLKDYKNNVGMLYGKRFTPNGRFAKNMLLTENIVFLSLEEKNQDAMFGISSLTGAQNIFALKTTQEGVDIMGFNDLVKVLPQITYETNINKHARNFVKNNQAALKPRNQRFKVEKPPLKRVNVPHFLDNVKVPRKGASFDCDIYRMTALIRKQTDIDVLFGLVLGKLADIEKTPVHKPQAGQEGESKAFEEMGVIERIFYSHQEVVNDSIEHKDDNIAILVLHMNKHSIPYGKLKNGAIGQIVSLDKRVLVLSKKVTPLGTMWYPDEEKNKALCSGEWDDALMTCADVIVEDYQGIYNETIEVRKRFDEQLFVEKAKRLLAIVALKRKIYVDVQPRIMDYDTNRSYADFQGDPDEREQEEMQDFAANYVVMEEDNEEAIDQNIADRYENTFKTTVIDFKDFIGIKLTKGQINQIANTLQNNFNDVEIEKKITIIKKAGKNTKNLKETMLQRGMAFTIPAYFMIFAQLSIPDKIIEVPKEVKIRSFPIDTSNYSLLDYMTRLVVQLSQNNEKMTIVSTMEFDGIKKGIETTVVRILQDKKKLDIELKLVQLKIGVMKAQTEIADEMIQEYPAEWKPFQQFVVNERIANYLKTQHLAKDKLHVVPLTNITIEHTDVDQDDIIPMIERTNKELELVGAIQFFQESNPIFQEDENLNNIVNHNNQEDSWDAFSNLVSKLFDNLGKLVAKGLEPQLLSNMDALKSLLLLGNDISHIQSVLCRFLSFDVGDIIGKVAFSFKFSEHLGRKSKYMDSSLRDKIKGVVMSNPHVKLLDRLTNVSDEFRNKLKTLVQGTCKDVEMLLIRGKHDIYHSVLVMAYVLVKILFLVFHAAAVNEVPDSKLFDIGTLQVEDAVSPTILISHIIASLINKHNTNLVIVEDVEKAFEARREEKKQKIMEAMKHMDDDARKTAKRLLDIKIIIKQKIIDDYDHIISADRKSALQDTVAGENALLQMDNLDVRDADNMMEDKGMFEYGNDVDNQIIDEDQEDPEND